MDAKRFVIGTLFGGVTVFATGTLLFSIAPVREFLAYAMNAGSATGVAREPQLVWAVALARSRTARSLPLRSGTGRVL